MQKQHPAHGSRHVATRHTATLALAVCLASFSLPVFAKDIAQTYATTCGVCHETGSLNAPKKGDHATWQRLIAQKGMDNLVNATQKGTAQMPAKGLCSTCTDADFRALIEHMAK